eukprot:6492258-Amphidinium_carterae.4
MKTTCGASFRTTTCCAVLNPLKTWENDVDMCFLDRMFFKELLLRAVMLQASTKHKPWKQSQV